LDGRINSEKKGVFRGREENIDTVPNLHKERQDALKFT